MSVNDFFVIVISYAFGCLVIGYYLVRWRKRADIRHLGSGSAGARNVGRILGKWGFWITLAGDLLRGILAIAVGRWLGASQTASVLSLPAVTAGHIFPVQLRFQGGKGIAVSLGALLVLDYHVAATCALIFAVLFLCSRRYMLSGMLSILLMPVVGAAFKRPVILPLSLTLLAGLILWAHRSNIMDLIRREKISIPVKKLKEKIK